MTDIIILAVCALTILSAALLLSVAIANFETRDAECFAAPSPWSSHRRYKSIVHMCFALALLIVVVLFSLAFAMGAI